MHLGNFGVFKFGAINGIDPDHVMPKNVKRGTFGLGDILPDTRPLIIFNFGEQTTDPNFMAFATEFIKSTEFVHKYGKMVQSTGEHKHEALSDIRNAYAHSQGFSCGATHSQDVHFQDAIANLDPSPGILGSDMGQRLNELGIGILKQEDFINTKAASVEKKEVPSMGDFLATLFRDPSFLVNKELDDLEGCVSDVVGPHKNPMATLDGLMAKIGSNENLAIVRNRIDVIYS